MTKFRDLSNGDTFDFINDATPMLNSYYERCVKLSARTYAPLKGDGQPTPLRVGSINAEVFHIGKRSLRCPAIHV